jgi:hypothetical protein
VFDSIHLRPDDRSALLSHYRGSSAPGGCSCDQLARGYFDGRLSIRQAIQNMMRAGANAPFLAALPLTSTRPLFCPR